jgi:hypothetical protein
MEGYLIRTIKCLAIAIVMFFSVFIISGDFRVGLLAAALPAVLGMLNLFTTFAYGVSAFAFVVAIAMLIFPIGDIVRSKDLSHQLSRMRGEMLGEAHPAAEALPSLQAPMITERAPAGDSGAPSADAGATSLAR